MCVFLERERERERVNYKLQSVFGSTVKPKETPQKPGKVAIAVALGLYVVMTPIMHLQIYLRLSIESEIRSKLTMASQHCDPGKGSGEPYVINVEQVETNAVTAEHSLTADTNVTIDSNINSPKIVDAFWLTI